jgi:hypothetical protein
MSYVPGRSGDVLAILDPYTILDDPPYLTTHGSPYGYDRRVPLIFQGPWATETRDDLVGLVDLAAPLAEQLGLHPSGPIDGKPLSLKPAHGRRT